VCGLAMYAISFIGHIVSPTLAPRSGQPAHGGPCTSMHNERQGVTVPAHLPTKSVEGITRAQRCCFYARCITGMRASMLCKHSMTHLVCRGGLRLRALAKAHALADRGVLGGRQRLYRLVRGVRRAEQLQRMRISEEVCSSCCMSAEPVSEKCASHLLLRT